MRKFLLSLLFFALPLCLFGADVVSQKIGLSLDPNSPNYKFELLLKKVILSVATNNKNIMVYSAEKADLEYSGVKELNGNVLMKTVKKQGAYQVELYQIDRAAILVDDTVKISLRDFANSIDDISLKIVGIIAKKFPPKPVQELNRIDVVKIKLSEFESQFGFWKISLIPSYVNFKANMKVEAKSNENQTVYLYGNTTGPGFSTALEASYFIQQWTFSLGLDYSFGGNSDYGFYGYTANGGVGFGIFGSLFIIGIGVEFNYARFTSAKTITAVNNFSVNVPDITVSSLWPVLYFRLNLTRDYSFFVSVSQPYLMWDETVIDFKVPGREPIVTSFGMSSKNGGPPVFKLMLDLRLFGKFHVMPYYVFNERSAHYEYQSFDDSRKPPLVKIENWILDVSFFLKEFGISRYNLGVGFAYEI